jgi:hypothetical protein
MLDRHRENDNLAFEPDLAAVVHNIEKLAHHGYGQEGSASGKGRKTAYPRGLTGKSALVGRRSDNHQPMKYKSRR